MSRGCQPQGSNVPELGCVLSVSAGDLVPQRKHTQHAGENPKELLDTAFLSAHIVGQRHAQTSRSPLAVYSVKAYTIRPYA